MLNKKVKEKAIIAGRIEGTTEIAKNLISMGLSLEQVAQAIKSSVEEVKKIIKDNVQ